MIDLTVITPTFNEQDSVIECIKQLRSTMEKDCPGLIYEHIVIDNASTDETVKRMLDEVKSDTRVKLIVNSRNIGASRSIYRALARAKGSWVVPMLPADLQDPVEMIPKLLAKAVDGVEVVYGIRKNRQESFVVRNLRKVYYRVLRKFSHFDLQNDAGEFVLISSRVNQSVIGVADENPYVRGLIAQVGAKSALVPYTWQQRRAGRSKSSPLVLADVAISGMVSTTYIPARIALLAGFTTSLIGFVGGLTYLVLSIFSSRDVSAGIPTLIISVFFLGGIQLFFLGLIGEYVLNIHRQIKPESKVTSTIELNF